MIETVEKDCKHPDCKYRRKWGGEPICAYLNITGKVRGCTIAECEKYSVGKVKVVSTLGGVIYGEDDIQ